MSKPIENLQPTSLWRNFSKLNAIPRASMKEEQAIQFVKKIGEDLGLETKVDELGNVLIRKPATKGKESSPMVVLQGHLDMVQQKNDDSDFDFATQGIQMYVDGDWVKAKGTTLGADNGIGVAAILSVLESNDMAHPPIEGLFTIDEEVSMTGAMGLQKDFLEGKILLNLDSEEDTSLTIGSAGGVDVIIGGKCKTVEFSKKYAFFNLQVEGLTGGHSGVDIHRGRSNAIKLLNRLLFELSQQFSIRLSKMKGGNALNAIPRACNAIIAIEKKQVAEVEAQLAICEKQIQQENNQSDSATKVSLQKVNKCYPVLSKKSQKRLVSSLYACPNGIYRMNPALNTLVQTSNNVSMISLKKGKYTISCHTRSFIESERDDLVNAIRASFLSLKATVTESNAYPGWNPVPNSPTLTKLQGVYEHLFEKAPNIDAIHAGLECGILAEIYPHLDIISFGPNITGAHSPDEAVQISSVQKIWRYLTAVLADL